MANPQQDGAVIDRWVGRPSSVGFEQLAGESCGRGCEIEILAAVLSSDAEQRCAVRRTRGSEQSAEGVFEAADVASDDLFVR